MKLLQLAQTIIAVLLILAILMQTRGAGLSGLFGGGGDIFRTKRGIEKTLFTLTIILSILFFGIAIANMIV